MYWKVLSAKLKIGTLGHIILTIKISSINYILHKSYQIWYLFL